MKKNLLFAMLVVLVPSFAMARSPTTRQQLRHGCPHDLVRVPRVSETAVEAIEDGVAERLRPRMGEDC